MLKTPIGRLRVVGMAEGLSFLLLLGVAMPLKYFAGMPLAVKMAGWAHGILFVAFCTALAQAKLDRGWSLAYAARLFIAALVPFGPFLVDGRLKHEDAGAAVEPAASAGA